MDTFTRYPIKETVERIIVESYQETGGDPNALPKLPGYVVGEIDFMIGIKYLRYHQEIYFRFLREKIFQFLSFRYSGAPS